MTDDLVPGLYESLLTEDLRERIERAREQAEHQCETDLHPGHRVGVAANGGHSGIGRWARQRIARQRMLRQPLRSTRRPVTRTARPARSRAIGWRSARSPKTMTSGASPTFHISPESAKKIQDNKLDTKITWVDGAQRFRYVLATPDISVKDLVGYVDAIKVAKKGVEMYKIDSYSPGQLLQAGRTSLDRPANQQGRRRRGRACGQ